MAALLRIIPVVILLAFVAGLAWVGYQMYVYTQQLADRGTKHMQKKNINFTKDGGMKVGVKEVRAEDYADAQQRALVDAWNHSSFPAYKSRLGWNQPKDGQKQ